MSTCYRYHISTFFLLAVLILLTMGLAGCGVTVGGNSVTASVTSPVDSNAFISGVAHGGRQPISGGTAALWAAGTTSGYGAGATLIATTTTATDGSGSFNFDTGSTSPCTTGQYLYITITGGSPDSSSGTNSYAALMAAIPNACNANTGAQYVGVSEASTVAAVWALRQFISVTPANVSAFASTPTAANAPWMIGAPSTNVTGLGVAFAKVGQMVTTSTGLSGNTNVYNTVNYGGSNNVTYNTTVAPETGHLYAIADILSMCVNSVDSTDAKSNTGSTLCTNLAGDVSTVISGSGPTPPQDTVQIAFYMAMAPGGIFVNPVNGATQGSALANVGGIALSATTAPATNQWPSKLCSNYVTASPAYSLVVGTVTWVCGLGTASSVSDFQINTRWSAVDTTTSAYTYGIKTAPGAVDANGNVWTVNFQTGVTAPGQPVVEWAPDGRIIQVVGGAGVLSSAAGTVTYPTSTLNVFVTTDASPGVPSATATTFNTTTSSVTLPQYIETYGTSAASTVPYDIAVDTNGNAWFTDVVGTGSPAVTSSTPIQQLTNGSATFNTGLLVKVAPATAISSCTIPCAQGNGTSIAGAVTGYATAAYPTTIAIDGANNIWLAGKPYSTAPNNASPTGNGFLMLMTAASNYLNIYEGQAASGNSMLSIAVDGSNHYAWATQSTTTAGKSVLRESINGLVNNAGSSTNTSGLNVLLTNFNTTGLSGIIPRYVAVDKYANAWVGEQNYNTGNLAYLNINISGLTPTSASVSITQSGTNTSGGVAENYAGGLDAPIALSIDGANNVWVGDDLSSTDGGVAVFYNTGAASSTTAGTNVALTPDNDTTYSFGFDAWNMDAPRAMEIDSAGNVYLGTGSNSYYGTMLGAAVPVVTPRAINSGLGQIATVTSWSIDGSGSNATFSTTNPPAVGATAILYGFTSGDTFLNNQVVTVTASTAGTSFSATVTGGSASYTGAAGGSASYIPLNNGTIGTKP